MTMTKRFLHTLPMTLLLGLVLCLVGLQERGVWEPWSAGGCSVDFVCDPAYGRPAPTDPQLEATFAKEVAIAKAEAKTKLDCEATSRTNDVPAKMVIWKDGVAKLTTWTMPAPAGWWTMRLCYEKTRT